MMQDNTRYIADNTHDIQEDKRLRRQIAIDTNAHAQKVCVQPSTEISSLLFARTQTSASPSTSSAQLGRIGTE